MINVNYSKNKDKLTLEFTEKGWEVWIAICFFKNIYRLRWTLDFTDRDRGFIEDIQKPFNLAGRISFYLLFRLKE